MYLVVNHLISQCSAVEEQKMKILKSVTLQKSCVVVDGHGGDPQIAQIQKGRRFRNMCTWNEETQHK